MSFEKLTLIEVRVDGTCGREDKRGYFMRGEVAYFHRVIGTFALSSAYCPLLSKLRFI